MKSRINKILDYLSEFFAHRKGLLPMVGLFLVFVNYILRLTLGAGILIETDLLLHLGIILAIFGFLIAWAL